MECLLDFLTFCFQKFGDNTDIAFALAVLFIQYINNSIESYGGKNESNFVTKQSILFVTKLILRKSLA